MEEEDLLAEYLEYEVNVYLLPSVVSPHGEPYEFGQLTACSRTGVVLQQDRLLTYIPFSSIQKIEIKPKPTLWERLTGS
ncbi:hypothetical protein [Brevibacillus fulvus]|uniref:Uncharacterized protein n=1 Tax=Brevibacillus fulvus TaxID=1125967 RepID=A0A938XX11_9BACL|nr:hypothetical protein [Brevibacillus fulvus]MBM7589451.1 hypothetical protein [Brevibacillus fulvus]